MTHGSGLRPAERGRYPEGKPKSSTSGTWSQVGLVALACACGSSDDRPPPPTGPSGVVDYDPTDADDRDVYAVGACTDGTTQTCRIYLPAHNGVQPCFVGVQACEDQAWGTCGDAVLVDANEGDAELEGDETDETEF